MTCFAHWPPIRPTIRRMKLLGSEHLDTLFAGEVNDLKMVFNATGAIIFPSTQQHRDAKVQGISYEDNYAGNALAAMLRRDAIEIRFHARYDDASVARIVAELLQQPALSRLADAQVTYQGRAI